MSPGIPELPELESLPDDLQLPPLSLDRGMELDVQDSPSMSGLEPSLQEGEGGQHRSGGVGLLCHPLWVIWGAE